MNRNWLFKLCMAFWFATLAALPAPRAEAQDEVSLEGGAATEPTTKSFDEVLTDLLNEFAYDLKTNAAQDVKNVSVRKVAVNESIPKSYENYVESMVVERFRTSSKIRVIHCSTCRVKKSVVENGKLHIIVPVNNPAEMDRLAQQLNIETWLDVALLYQETSMVLAFNAFDSKSKELVWTKVYNSESIYRKKLAEAQGESLEGDAAGGTAKKKIEEPERFVFSLGLGYASVANVKGRTSMLATPLRASERFANGHSEVGAMVIPIFDPDMFVSTYKNVEGDPISTGEAKESTSTTAIKPFRAGAALMATYHHNFFAGAENYDGIRYGMMLGFGPVVSSGYLSLTARGGMLLKFGRHFLIDGGLWYSAPTTITIQKRVTFKTQGGVGGDVCFGLLF